MTDKMYPEDRLNCCPVCGGNDVRVFFELPRVPIQCHVHYETRTEALDVPRGDVRLAFCRTCGHFYNPRFQPELMRYTEAYDNSLHFSPRFRQYAESLADDLVERYDIRQKTVIDVGCGKGEFLSMICERGANRGIGFDPSYFPAGYDSESITFVRDYYSDKYSHIHADLICCRHVLEHVDGPTDFIRSIRRSLAEEKGTVVFFEVPNALYTIQDLGIWDIIYEHYSYFTINSLVWLFGTCGFCVRGAQEGFGGQFLTIEASYADAAPLADHLIDFDAVEHLIESFQSSYARKLNQWGDTLVRLARLGRRVVAWGGGSKGVTFLNALQSRDLISYVVDINPRKQGFHVAGTGQKIVSPDFLRTYRPDVVLIMNPNYRDEIQQSLLDRGLACEMMLV